MPFAQKLSLLSAGGFFLTGLLCGVWKYRKIHASPTAQSSTYVDIAHRAALMYAFSCLLLERMVASSHLDHRVKSTCVVALVFYFAWAQLGYIIHGWLGDTDNQFRRPHRLGRLVIPDKWMSIFMISLIVFELGATVTLLVGVIDAQCLGPASPGNRHSPVPEYSTNQGLRVPPAAVRPRVSSNLTNP